MLKSTLLNTVKALTRGIHSTSSRSIHSTSLVAAPESNDRVKDEAYGGREGYERRAEILAKPFKHNTPTSPDSTSVMQEVSRRRQAEEEEKSPPKYNLGTEIGYVLSMARRRDAEYSKPGVSR